MVTLENAAKIIQSHFRRSVEISRFMSIKKAVCLLQTAIRAWLFVKLDSLTNQFGANKAQKLSYGMYSLAESQCNLFSFRCSYLTGVLYI